MQFGERVLNWHEGEGRAGCAELFNVASWPPFPAAESSNLLSLKMSHWEPPTPRHGRGASWRAAVANATAQHLLASLAHPGSSAGPHGGAGVQAAGVVGAEAPEDITVPGAQPGSRTSAGFSNRGLVPVSVHCMVRYTIF